MTLGELKYFIAKFPDEYDNLEVYLPDQEYGPYHIKLKTIVPGILLECDISGPPIFKYSYENPTQIQLK